MARILFGLAMLSGFLALTGCVWLLVTDLRARKAAEGVPGSGEGQVSTAGPPDPTVVAGQAPLDKQAGQPQASFSFAGVGHRLRAEGWRHTLPWLLVASGLLATLMFGALALVASLPSKVVGLAAVVVAAYIAASEIRSFWQALRGHNT